MNAYFAGYQVVTADIAVNTAGSAVVVYGVNIISDGTAGVVNLRGGDAVGDSIVMALTGTINKGIYIDFGAGVVFPDGCFVDISANVTPSCTLVYEKI
jgi:hypothetical protein